MLLNEKKARSTDGASKSQGRKWAEAAADGVKTGKIKESWVERTHKRGQTNRCCWGSDSRRVSVHACVSASHPAPAFLRLLHMLTTIRDELWWWELYNPIPL